MLKDKKHNKISQILNISFQHVCIDLHNDLDFVLKPQTYLRILSPFFFFLGLSLSGTATRAEDQKTADAHRQITMTPQTEMRRLKLPFYISET